MERRPPVKISILEKDESEVSHCWKYCQIFSYIMVIISGIATSLAMANVQGIFHHECLLYADLAISTSPENNWTIIITPHAASRWGSSSHCDFTQYCPVASVIFAGIWATIFVMCGRGGASSRNLPQPWRIIPPAILFNFIFLVLSCVSVALTVGGFASFCASVTPQINVSSCEDLIGFSWERYVGASNFYDDVLLAQTGAYFVLTGWMFGFVILIIRVITHADFRVIGPDRKASAEIGTPTPTAASRTTRRSQTVSISSSSSSPGGATTSRDMSSSPPKREDRPLLLLNNNNNNVHTPKGLPPV